MGSYTPPIRRIGIIGAGPVGVAFAKSVATNASQAQLADAKQISFS